MFQVKFEVKF